jgi:hypothetical protein
MKKVKPYFCSRQIKNRVKLDLEFDEDGYLIPLESTPEEDKAFLGYMENFKNHLEEITSKMNSINEK